MRGKVKVTALKQQLLNRIDQDDLKEVEKVERYCGILEMIRTVQAQVKKDGSSVKIETANQLYYKSHPGLADIVKLNAQLLNIERAFQFIADVTVTEEPKTTGRKKKEAPPEYTVDDLI